MPIRLYNTLTRSLEELTTGADRKLRMFVCGPTVYDYIHIGNARTFVVFDVVAKWLRWNGYEVDYIMNITDIDDRIIARSAEQKEDALVYARRFEDAFKEDASGIGITAPRYERATDYIDQIVHQVRTLRDKGHAYFIENDGWYFDLSTFPEYGKLSGRRAQEAEDAVSRIDESSAKRNTGDFALWKLSKPGEPVWKTELGDGRPGWHIEDTAITEKNFGPQYDIHGGARDLIFPHHEAEITQMESASGKVPFVRYWMHAGFLENKARKMSKSLGNFATLHELLQGYPREALRLFLLGAHYRVPLDFNDTSMEQAVAALDRIAQFMQRLEHYAGGVGSSDGRQERVFSEVHEGLRAALNDDFNTQQAIGHLFTAIQQGHALIDHTALGAGAMHAVIRGIFALMDEVLGIIPSLPEIPDDIMKLAADRDEARRSKDFKTADEIRGATARAGYTIDDTPTGPLIKKK